MLKKTIFGLCLLLSFYSFGQESVKGSTQLNELVLSEKNGKVRVDAEKTASFPLGSIAFQNMLSKNFKMKNVVTNNAEQISCELILLLIKKVL